MRVACTLFPITFYPVHDPRGRNGACGSTLPAGVLVTARYDDATLCMRFAPLDHPELVHISMYTWRSEIKYLTPLQALAYEA